MKKTFILDIPPQLLKHIEERAKKEERSRVSFIEWAVKWYLATKEEQKNDKSGYYY